MINPRDIFRLVAGNVFPTPATYQIDPAHCFVGFSTQHLVISQIWGWFEAVTGTIKIEENPFNSSVEIDIDAKSLHTHSEGRDKDLLGELFFDSDKYPKMRFTSTAVKPELFGRFAVEGNLTIKDITRPVSLSVRVGGVVEDPWGNIRLAFRAKTKLNRRDFGLTHDLDRDSGGLPVVKDVAINISAEAIVKK